MRRNRKAEASGFSLWREDLWIPDSTDTGAPGPHITEALPGLWWPDHRRSGFDSSFLSPLHPNRQLRDMLSLLFSLFSDQGFLLVRTLSSLHLWPEQHYRSFAFTFLRNSAGSACLRDPDFEPSVPLSFSRFDPSTLRLRLAGTAQT